MKHLAPSKAMKAANIFMWGGTAILAIDLLNNGLQSTLIPAICGIALAIIGIVIRFTLVKCPHCGDRFIGMKKLPSTCPGCDKPVE